MDTVTPLLMLLAGRDDWTPPAACETRARDLAGQGRLVRAKVYPSATHGFDQPGQGRMYLGHFMTYDGAATSDARVELEKFLADALR
ncbi:MAG: dienelactone hydrolase family protein [Candidatus Rokubacteria bacterium]|nr:dienelactone hydrolase family protein [Candidatus Rokubacteria bacterium]